MIDRNTSLERLGAIVCQSLKDAGIDSFLSGGAVVSIYTKNKYESFDLDFVSFADRKKIRVVMEGLGFLQDRSRLFRHPKSPYMVEFPGTAVQIGDERIQQFAERKVGNKVLKLLTPTDCVKDRLAAFIHWNDRQGLVQASMVASEHTCKLDEIREFCRKEGKPGAFQALLSQMQQYSGEADRRLKLSAPQKVHPWRLCPYGQHWVRRHTRGNTPHGVHGYCRDNPNGKDELQELEMDEIAERNFHNLKTMPCPKTVGYSQGGKFDVFIAGWTTYWNDVLEPSEPLSANMVKAVIATESGFRTLAQNPGNRRIGKARGLMQVTESTLGILRDEHGELKDHFVVLDVQDLFRANQNICAGIRWLFRKRDLASLKLGRQATWIEAVAEYKSYLRQFHANPKFKKMGELIEKYETLEKC